MADLDNQQAGWHSQSAEAVAERLEVDVDSGLDAAELSTRRERYGPNQLPTEPKPSVWTVARAHLTNPMNVMLLIVGVASLLINEVPTALVVIALAAFNILMGTKQELKAQASVDALAELQVPHARVRRDGHVEEIESTALVPGDVMLLEAGDVVPADGRIISSATLELQEAALTGESAPVPKDGASVLEDDTALGDRTNLVFQNTEVTRGSADGGGHRDRSIDADGPDRRHGQRNEAVALPAAAGVGRADQGLRRASPGSRSR